MLFLNGRKAFNYLAVRKNSMKHDEATLYEDIFMSPGFYS